MVPRIAACVVVLLAALATADPTLTVSSSAASACDKSSLTYFLVKTSIDKDLFDEFEAQCDANNRPSPALPWIDGVVQAQVPKAVAGLTSKTDSLERRLAKPSFPKCNDLYACPPGPCSMYDIGYQNGYSTNTTSGSFTLQSKGICGPTFNVQAVDRATQTSFPDSIDSATSEAFPSLYETGSLIFDPSTPASPSLVPALGNIVNQNPPWYYINIPAWETASNNPDNINGINCAAANNQNKKPHTFPPAALSASTPEYGNLVDYAQDPNMLSDPTMANVYPQTYKPSSGSNATAFVINQTLLYKNYCDLSQCYYVPMARKVKVGRDKDKAAFDAMHKTVNCILIEFLRAQIAPAEARPLSCFELNKGVNAFGNGTSTTSPYKPFNDAFTQGKTDDWWYNAFARDAELQNVPQFTCTSDVYKITSLASYILDKPSRGGKNLRNINRDTFYQCFDKQENWQDFKSCLKAGLSAVSSHPNFKGTDTYNPSKDYVAYGVFLAYNQLLTLNNNNIAPVNYVEMLDGLFATTDSAQNTLESSRFKTSATGTKKIQPIQNAVTDFPPLVPATFITHNASILNDFQKSESAACNCNNEGIIYAWLDLPWFSDLPEAYTAASSPIVFPASDSAAYSATALRESAYSWASDAGGDFRDGLPIGLYVPSSRRYGRNFVTYERNYLSLQETTTAGINSLDQTLANDYLFAPKSPNATVLQNELVFNVTAFQSQRHATRKLTYRYGSCMKPPYGQISSFELDAATFSKLYTNCTADLKSCTIAEESLMGYCDPVQAMLDEDPKLPYCFDDPLTYAQRQTLCTSKLAKHIVLARVLVARSAEHVCNSDSKTCLVIPEEPVHALSTVLSSEKVYGNLDGYTILVAPFNWTMATMLTSGIRYAYPTSNISNIATIDEDDTTWLGMQSVAEEYFETLYDQSKGSAFVIEAVDSMCRVLNTSYDAKTNAYTIPYLRGVVPTITPEYVFPRHALAQVPVTYDNVALASATTTQPLRVQPAYSATNGDTPCTFVYVAGSNFSLAATNVDMTFCNPSTAGIDAAAVVFGGSNVSQARIHLDYAPNSANIRTPVIFAGDDTMHFPKSKTVNASMVRIAMAQPTADARLQKNANQIDVYDIGAARAFGTVYVEMPRDPAVPAGANTTIRTIEQLLANTTLTWVPVTPETNVSRLDVSQYTKVYGNNVLQLVFPESKAKKHGSTVIFACSLIGIVFVLGELTRAYLDKDRMAALEANATIGNNRIKDTAFGKEAENSKTGERKLVRDFLTKGKTTNDEAESFRNLVDKDE